MGEEESPHYDRRIEDKTHKERLKELTQQLEQIPIEKTAELVLQLQEEKSKNEPGDVVNRIVFNYGIKEWTTTDTVEGFLEEIDRKMYEDKRSSDR